MRLLAVVAGIAIVLAGRPASADKARADKLFEDGRKYLAGKEYALACTAFEESQKEDPAIGTQLNIALCYEEWGKTASAYRAYVEAVRLAKLKFDARAKGAQAKADQLAEKVPHLQLEVPDDADVGAVFLFDGKELDRAKLADDLLVDAGTHVIEVRISGRPPKKTVVDLQPGERRRVAIEMPPAPPNEVTRMTPRKKGRLYGGIALTSGGAIAIGVATVVAFAARQDYIDALERGCDDAHVCSTQEAYDATQDARSKANLMTFVGAGGVVLVGVGVYLIATSGGHRVTERVTVAPTLTPDGVGLAIGGSL